MPVSTYESHRGERHYSHCDEPCRWTGPDRKHKGSALNDLDRHTSTVEHVEGCAWVFAPYDVPQSLDPGKHARKRSQKTLDNLPARA